MALRTIIEKDGSITYEAYWNARSSIDSRIRIQRTKKCKTESEAIRAEKQLIKDTTEEVKRQEARGNCWDRVISVWETEACRDGVFCNPLTGKRITQRTIHETVCMLRNWTEDWLPIPAPELNRGHGGSLIVRAQESDLKKKSVQKIKNTVNNVFMFGIQEGLIKGVSRSPVHGVAIEWMDSEALPEILRVDEVQKLLLDAKARNHTWYPIWAMALMTGMRSSELYALRKANVLFDEGLIRISESWDWFLNEAKSTKAKYWRNSPICPEMRPIIENLMAADPESEFLLPRIREWRIGEQATVLRSFCSLIGITSVRFHALRACFATHLLASGVDEATVMRIGGWRDFRTFQIYVRLAGIREKGATDQLGATFLPSDQAVAKHISAVFRTVAA